MSIGAVIIFRVLIYLSQRYSALHTLTDDVNFLQSFADRKCSGRKSCQVKISDLVHVAQPCPVELSSYFEASYLCEKGRAL